MVCVCVGGGGGGQKIYLHVCTAPYNCVCFFVCLFFPGLFVFMHNYLSVCLFYFRIHSVNKQRAHILHFLTVSLHCESLLVFNLTFLKSITFL